MNRVKVRLKGSSRVFRPVYFFVLILFAFSLASASVASSAQLTTADFIYQGAFRLPEEFNWGARGL